MLIIMSVLGAVVMPHNLFLHSEVIQSHEYNKKDDASIKKVLKYELFDTLFSMIVGWAINSAMILLAAATFFKSGIQVEELFLRVFSASLIISRTVTRRWEFSCLWELPYC